MRGLGSKACDFLTGGHFCSCWSLFSPDWSPAPPATPCGLCSGSCPVSAADEPAWWSRRRVAWASLWIRPPPPAATPLIGPAGPLVSLKPPCEDGPLPALAGFSPEPPGLSGPRLGHLMERMKEFGGCNTWRDACNRFTERTLMWSFEALWCFCIDDPFPKSITPIF